MDTDLALVIGCLLAVLSVPSFLSALSDDRPPRASALTVLIAGGLILYALTTNPGGYSFAELPDVFVSVAADFLP